MLSSVMGRVFDALAAVARDKGNTGGGSGRWSGSSGGSGSRPGRARRLGGKSSGGGRVRSDVIVGGLGGVLAMCGVAGAQPVGGPAGGERGGLEGGMGGGAVSGSTQLVDRVDWPGFLGRQDLVWDRLPEVWASGAFTGNGQLGAMIMAEPGTPEAAPAANPAPGAPVTGAGAATTSGAARSPETLNWRIGRSDVTFKAWRIPVGTLRLRPAGRITGGSLRVDLWNAETTGTVRTDRGSISFRTFTHADDLVQVIEVTPDAGEQASWEWVPGIATDTRRLFLKQPISADDKNAPPVRTVDEVGGGPVDVSEQPLKPAGSHATAWQVVPGSDGQGGTQGGGRSSVVYLSVGYGKYDGLARGEAVAAVRRAAARGLAALTQSHRAWWHRFWPASFVSFPDSRLESFYWIQMYKMASATRPGRPALDLMGPWFNPTPWTMFWWNLNVQLTYWPQLASNRLELGESLIELIDRNVPALNANAGPYYKDSANVGRTSSYDCLGAVTDEVGNLVWTLHNYYLQYRYSMDESLLRRLFPVLKRAVNYYLNVVKEGPDGKLHITVGHSPEYPDQPKPNPDTNYDLSLLRWGCTTLLSINERLGLQDPLAAKWRKTLDGLTPYPTDENGLRISASMPFAASHRHYSHLLMIYPLYLMTPEQPENRELVVRSLKHWMSLPERLEGYSFTGAASISALLGDGNEAHRYLNRLLDTKVLANTLYTEWGPVIETPLSAAASVHDMLLSSWGDRMRVFPGVPDAWADITFRDLRAEGAFLVSAARRGGTTQWVRVTSLAGEPCRVKPSLAGEVKATVPMKALGDDTYELTLGKGESAVLYTGAAVPELEVEAVSLPGEPTRWGLPATHAATTRQAP